jgi:hypothetical protein
MKTITDVVLGFSSSNSGSWVKLRSDGQNHPTANGRILDMIMNATVHQTPVKITLADDGTVTGVSVTPSS